ncbi:F390 synthetase-related protein [uncultured Shewanella sp.]|uniref:F390 synthetase-related protein n=1 Tax=uncultured Shewanella sp. TaxID=173975 RepID=UPI00262084F2|nr:F390 synthetase-related protein [uncultured Shewanella sp.]
MMKNNPIQHPKLNNTLNKLICLGAFAGSFVKAKYYHKRTRTKLEKHQEKCFIRFKQKVLTHSPYYQAYLDLPLAAFPVINKKIHMANFDRINTAHLLRDEALSIAIQAENTRDFSPSYGQYAVGLSSGTSGNKGLFISSKAEQAQWAGDMVAKAFPQYLKPQRIAFFLRANNKLYESSRSVLTQFRFFDLLTELEHHVSTLEAYNPTILIAPASVLLHLSRLQPAIIPKKIIAVAEVLEEEDKQQISAYFGQKIHQIYQCTEGFLGITCSHGNLHLNEDNLIIEKHWVNQAQKRFSPIVTDLRRTTQPIVRYLLDDVLIENTTTCPCGSSHTRIQSIEGRKDDVLQLTNNSNKQIDVYSDFIRNTIVSHCEKVKEYRVTQTHTNALLIECEPYDNKDNIVSSLHSLFNKLDIKQPDYQFRPYQYPKKGEKRRRVINTVKSK